MTVSTTSARVAYAGNGSTTAFTVPWLFLSNADLQVRKRSSSGTESTLAVGTDYTVAGALSPSGGTVTLLAPPATGETVVIIRDPIIIQSTDYLPNDPFPAESHERALDLLTMIAQRLDDRLDRALVLAESDTPGAGAFQGGGNRITNLAPGTQSSDAVTLLQVQSLISSSGGGGGGTSGGGGSVVVPDSEIDRIIALTVIDPSLTSLFDPLNASVGNLASQILGLNDSVGSINTSVGTITVRLVDLQSQIDALSVISGDANNIITLLATETTNRIAGDTAIVAVLDKMGAADGDNVSFLLNLDTVKVGPTETLSARLSSITSQFGTVSANVTAEATARAASDTAISQTIAKLGALNGTGTAFVIDLNTAYVGVSESLGQRLSGIATSVNANAAAILSEQSTRANADSALSTTLTTLQTTVNGHTTTISTQATTINGIQAKYAVKVDNNGYVSGFGLISTANNGTVTSTFNILADAFKVYNGTTAVAPFEVVGGVVYIKEANIQTLQVGKLIAGGDARFTPRAWARFYGKSTGAYIARQSNIASIVRNNTGRYTVTFASALPNKYYCVQPNANRFDDDTDPQVIGCHSYTTTGFQISVKGTGGNFNDALHIDFTVFGTDDPSTVPPTAYDPQNDPAVTTNWSRVTNSGTLVP